MAKVRYSAIISDISGSVGSATFQRNRYGNSLRSKPIQSKKATPARGLVAANMATVQAAWSALSEAQKKEWSNYLLFSGYAIKNTEGIALSTFNVYLKYQLLRLWAQLDLLESPSYEVVPSPFLQSELIYVPPGGGNPSDLFLSVPGLSGGIPASFVLHMSPVFSSSKSFVPSRFRVVNYITEGLGEYLVGDSYFNSFYRRPIAGDVISIKIVAFSLYAPVVFADNVQVITVIE